MWKKFLLAGAASLLIAGAADAAPRVYLPFSFTSTGDVFGADGPQDDPVRGKNDPVWFTTDQLVLKDYFLTDATYGGKDASECFGDGVFERVDMQLSQTNKGWARASLWFRGYTSDGQAIKYLLTLLDPLGWDVDLDYDFPPIGDTVTMIATQWTMETEGKGKLKNVSCTGAGDDTVTTITLTQ